MTESEKKCGHMSTSSWAALLHATLLCGILFPIGGFIVPFLLWIIKRDTEPALNDHVKEILNFVITVAIAFAVSGLLVFLVLGIPLLIIVALYAVIMPIVAAVKISNGETWRYPFIMRLVK